MLDHASSAGVTFEEVSPPLVVATQIINNFERSRPKCSQLLGGHVVSPAASGAGGGIFLSYRREDTRHLAGRLYDRLARRFGANRIFMDIDSIEPGADFAKVISSAVASCGLLLALIGPGWLNVKDEYGNRRLDDPDDLVGLEIVAALENGVRVVPILVDGAPPLARVQLPSALVPLARLNAIRLDHETFRSDVDSLLGAIVQVLASVPTRSPADGNSKDGFVANQPEVEAGDGIYPTSSSVRSRRLAKHLESLAHGVAPDAARVACILGDEDSGSLDQPEIALSVRLLVVPRVTTDYLGRISFEALINPPGELLRRIKNRLAQHPQIDGALVVEPPRYQGVTVVARVTAEPGARVDDVQTATLQALNRSLSPQEGGRNGYGWPFGRALRVFDMFAALTQVADLDSVDDLLLFPADPVSGTRAAPLSQLNLRPDQLFYSYQHQVRVQRRDS